MANHDKIFSDIKLSTTGIIFLGTPHQGSDAAVYDLWLAEAFGHDTTLLESLKRNSSTLLDIARDLETIPTNMGSMRRKVFVLHGPDGIEKTQLSVEFARQYHMNYTAVFWVDGSTKERLKRGIADLAGRISQHQISENSGQEKSTRNTDVLDWLSQPSNDQWLLIFDNVDRKCSGSIEDPEAFNVQEFFPIADQGSILITSRLASLCHLGTDMKVNPVNQLQGERILENCLGQSMQGQCDEKNTCSGVI